MITSEAMPAPLPAHIGMSQINPITVSKDFADPLVIPHILPFAGMADRHPRAGCRQRRAIGVPGFLLLLDQGFRSRSSLLLW